MTDITFNDADEAIVQQLREGRNLAANLAGETGYERHYLSDRLGRLAEHGLIRNVGNGLYELIPEAIPDDARTPTIYTAGAMDWVNEDDSYWRRSVEAEVENATFSHPDDTWFDHGGDMVAGCVSEDIEFLDHADAIVAYFTRSNQVGTMTELLHALETEMPALCVFDPDVVHSDDGPFCPARPADLRVESRDYWFLLNYLVGDGRRTSPYHSSSPNIRQWQGREGVTVWLADADNISPLIETWVANEFETPAQVAETLTTATQPTTK